MEYELQMIEADQMEMCRQTEVLDSLGERFETFWGEFVDYLTEPPLRKKHLVVGGLSGSGKGTFISQVLARLETEEKVLKFQQHYDRMYRYYCLNLGRCSALAMENGLVNGPLGEIKSLGWTRISTLMADTVYIAKTRLPDPALFIYEAVLTTGVLNDYDEIDGIDKGLKGAKYLAGDGAFCVLLSAPESLRDRTFQIRSAVLRAQPGRVHHILEDVGIVDDRSDPQEIKWAYERTGNRSTRVSGDKIVNELMTRLVRQGRIIGPRFNLRVPSAFSTHPDERLRFIEENYYPYFLGQLYGQENPARGFIFPNRMLDKEIHIYGNDLDRFDLITALEREATRTGSLQSYLALSFLGVLNPLSCTQNPEPSEEASSLSPGQFFSAGSPCKRQPPGFQSPDCRAKPGLRSSPASESGPYCA